MNLAASLLPEFDQEMGSTRRVLERVPEDKLTWQPHRKSMSFGGLVTHLANLPTWTLGTLEQDTFDMAPADGEAPRVDPVESVGAGLALFDENVGRARAAIESASDERLLGPWTLLAGGETVFTTPRIAVVKSFVVNHVIHHRAQLGVYLRLNDVAVPSLYGPTADEGG
jgi:uncharacterized damage-inducible protein DinB